jgi:hypothetical protein
MIVTLSEEEITNSWNRILEIINNSSPESFPGEEVKVIELVIREVISDGKSTA